MLVPQTLSPSLPTQKTPDHLGGLSFPALLCAGKIKHPSALLRQNEERPHIEIPAIGEQEVAAVQPSGKHSQL